MSKNTKVIAIIGGVLILGMLGYMWRSKGGFGAAFEAMGCGGKKGAESKRGKLSNEDQRKAQTWNSCVKRGFAAKFDDKGKVVRKGNNVMPDGTMKAAKLVCQKLWKAKCELICQKVWGAECDVEKIETECPKPVMGEDGKPKKYKKGKKKGKTIKFRDYNITLCSGCLKTLKVLAKAGGGEEEEEEEKEKEKEK